MTRSLLLSGFAMLLMTMTGCAMCAHPFDNDYGAFGGTWERADPSAGRVVVSREYYDVVHGL